MNNRNLEYDRLLVAAEAAVHHPGAWASTKLAYLYIQAHAIAETMDKGSPAETALRLAMSKIDEADMCIKGIEVLP